MLDRFRVGPLPGFPHVYTIIFLHDKQGNGHDFARRLFTTRADDTRNHGRSTNIQGLLEEFRFVFPTSPLRSESGNEFEMEWFRENSDGQEGPYQPTLEQAIDAVLELIRDEERLVPRSQIFLGGFGQGFALAVSALFADGRGDLAGVIGLNGWMPFYEEIGEGNPSQATLIDRCRTYFQPMRFSEDLAMVDAPTPTPPVTSCADSDASYQNVSLPDPPSTYGILQRIQTGDIVTPIFMSHTIDNDVVPHEVGYEAVLLINDIGLPIHFEEYDEGTTHPRHGINEYKAINDMCQWIRIQCRARLFGNLFGEHTHNGA